MHCADKFLLKVFKVNITVVLLLYLKSIKLLTVYRDLLTTMASHGQKQGLCGHLMAGFDSHGYCSLRRDKGKGTVSWFKN